ncbi:ribosome silencing factor [Thalassotalea aquiviva]|uniref:ribosome silencing factor n=1 Tax=Thalassotalea aquiviva TaxID=3242415 RepID=UPI00352B0504
MQTEQLVEFVQTKLEDIKARDIVTLDVTDKASFTDCMIICSGNSSRHVRSIAENINTEAKKENIEILGIEGADVGEWGLIDLGDVVVHVMTDDIRDLYQLEKLWA